MPAGHEGWLIEYGETANRAFRAIGAVYGRSAAEIATNLRTIIGKADAEWQADSLSQMAIRALRSTTGVTSVLVGMRTPDYVDDVLAELRHPIEQLPRKEAWEGLAKITQL